MLLNQLCKNKHLLFHIIYKSILLYFTFWVIILQCFYYLGFLKKYQYSIFLLTLLVSICGFIIIHIYPKKIITPVINYKLKYEECLFMDLIFHHLPLIMLLIFYDNKTKNDNLILFALTILIYLLINDPIKIYHL